ncbi:MAG: hypothetical protein U9Q73_00415 [Nanoarchaeota archaeon]|nr:hypothetical protein [Nanoarchaeota archaeon]
MDSWIWAVIIAVVLIIVWLSLRKKKNNYEVTMTDGGLWDKVKDACCVRGR